MTHLISSPSVQRNATILVDTREDIAIVEATNFPGDIADAAMLELIQTLYERERKSQIRR